MPPAPTTSTRPPATASASSRGSPRDSAMAGRPRAAAEAEARELSRGRKQVGEGRPSFRSCALRPPVGAERATPGTGEMELLGPGWALREVAPHTSRYTLARSCFKQTRKEPLCGVRKPEGHLLAWGLNSQPGLTG